MFGNKYTNNNSNNINNAESRLRPSNTIEQ